MHKRGLCRHAVSVCVSVCLSVTFVHSVETSKHIFKIFSPFNSQVILVFPHQTSWHYSDRTPPLTGDRMQGLWKNHDCLWGNVEASCHKHFVVFSRNQYCLLLPASRRNIVMPFGTVKLEWLGYTRWWNNFEDMFIRFDRMHERDGHTHTQTDTAWRHRHDE